MYKLFVLKYLLDAMIDYKELVLLMARKHIVYKLFILDKLLVGCLGFIAYQPL